MRGREFEEEAVSYLKKLGYRILARNYRTRFGELDIVALKRKTLVFVEVKGGKGEPRFRVDRRKLRRIELAANDFLSRVDVPHDEVRLDVVEITPEGVRHLVGISL